jgi:hypothetical protein
LREAPQGWIEKPAEGLEEVGDGVWNFVYYSTVLGRTDIQTGKITGSDNV